MFEIFLEKSRHDGFRTRNYHPIHPGVAYDGLNYVWAVGLQITVTLGSITFELHLLH